MVATYVGGEGINMMRRLVHARKRVWEFLAAGAARGRMNLTNVLQLAARFPQQMRLALYRETSDVTEKLALWVPALRQDGFG